MIPDSYSSWKDLSNKYQHAYSFIQNFFQVQVNVDTVSKSGILSVICQLYKDQERVNFSSNPYMYTIISLVILLENLYIEILPEVITASWCKLLLLTNSVLILRQFLGSLAQLYSRLFSNSWIENYIEVHQFILSHTCGPSWCVDYWIHNGDVCVFLAKIWKSNAKLMYWVYCPVLMFCLFFGV